jgi:transformation/transcription domain-associated protein
MQAINHTKSVKVLMQSVQMCQPQPKLPAELTKCIAKNHCAWHIGVPLLESHVILFPEETRTFHALADLYRAVNEEDLALGLWRSKYVQSPSCFQVMAFCLANSPSFIIFQTHSSQEFGC